MSVLASLAPVATQVDVFGTEVNVYGLSTNDITVLMTKFKEQVADLFESKKDLPAIIQECPEVVVQIICMGCRDTTEEGRQAVREWPVGVQQKVLAQVWDSSMVDVELLGKMFSGLISGMEVMASQLESLPETQKD